MRTKALALIAVVAGGAVTQAVLLAGNPDVTATPLFVLVAALSLLAVIAEVWLLAALCTSGRLGGLGLLAWSAAFVLLAGAAAVWALPAVPVVVLAAALLLPSSARRDPVPQVTVFRGIRQHPGRFVVLVVVLLVVVAMAWVAALILGLFVTGPAAHVATWLLFGGAALLLLCLGSRVSTKPR